MGHKLHFLNTSMENSLQIFVQSILDYSSPKQFGKQSVMQNVLEKCEEVTKETLPIKHAGGLIPVRRRILEIDLVNLDQLVPLGRFWERKANQDLQCGETSKRVHSKAMV